MNRYFFDFDDVLDIHGIEMPTADEALDQAMASMPEYVAEQLLRDNAEREMTCTIRENDGGTVFRIFISMRVENAIGEPVPRGRRKTD